MICPKCKAELNEREKFCSQCGAKMQNYCFDCGIAVGNAKFCPNCGKALNEPMKINYPVKMNYSADSETKKTKPVYGNPNNQVVQPVVQAEDDVNSNRQNEPDQYEECLEKKKKKETIGNTIAFSIVGILCLILFVNNWGYTELMEIVFKCAIVSFFIFAVYFAIAASMGFYGANKYLHKYRQMKHEIGKAEAVKMIEQQFNPNEGFSMLKGSMDAAGKGIGAAGGCVGGCLSSIIGFSLTIIMIILIMAFC